MMALHSLLLDDKVHIHFLLSFQIWFEHIQLKPIKLYSIYDNNQLRNQSFKNKHGTSWARTRRRGRNKIVFLPENHFLHLCLFQISSFQKGLQSLLWITWSHNSPLTATTHTLYTHPYLIFRAIIITCILLVFV